MRLFLLTLFSLGCLILFRRQNFIDNQTVFYPGQKPTNVNSQKINDRNNYYVTGKYDMSIAPVPKWNQQNLWGFLDIVSRKKINGYMFSQYNQYKMEINFIDLFYTSMVQINYWAEDVGHISVTQKIGFSLDEDFNKANFNLDFQKNNFKLNVRQMSRIGRDGQNQIVTKFNGTVIQNNTEIQFNYTHMRREQQCFTAVRNGVISHKCFGGYGYGKVRLDVTYWDEEANSYKRRLSSYNPRANQTRCSFDGFRGSGWDWKWTWAYGTGFSKPEFYSKNQTIQKQRWIGFNFGSLYNKSQDFLFLNGKIYPISGAKYQINQVFPIKQNITFTAQNPQINMIFSVKSRSSTYQDVGIFKNDIVKAQGHWIGYLMDPQNKTNKIQFYQMSGLIESAHLLI